MQCSPIPPSPLHDISTNGYTQKEMYLGVSCKMHLLLAEDMVQGIKQAGRQGQFPLLL